MPLTKSKSNDQQTHTEDLRHCSEFRENSKRSKTSFWTWATLVRNMGEGSHIPQRNQSLRSFTLADVIP